MASHYYAPAIKTLCSFFNEDSGTWINVHNGGVFQYKRKSGGPPGFEIPAWEKTARRYVFSTVRQTRRANGSMWDM